ncbi:hypothetical protein [Metasolibacillus meyeri]|uniref:hypothetical protein n=1 Tax=Metasolibacillus meyeri TaxID=1071052 RepID=UPI000D2F682F|nr:hypothetical protein [Metasolibacillus meyeri]
MGNVQLINTIVYQISTYTIDAIYEDAEYDLHPYFDDGSVEIIKDKIHITFERTIDANSKKQAIHTAKDYIHTHYKNRNDWTVLNVSTDDIEWIPIVFINYAVEIF